jgi:ribosomal protein L11 methyltransferase
MPVPLPASSPEAAAAAGERLVELVLRVPLAHVEAASDALIEELQALSVTVEDADAGSAQERALFAEPGLPAPAPGWERSTLRALFAEAAQAQAAAALLLAQPWGQELCLSAVQDVQPQDWVRLTQSQFAPVEVAPGFWIVPSWHDVPRQARTVIRLDPGRAFGTGTHPTTRLVLRWLVQQAPALATGWERVLDYGCGSGVLAIAAGKLGARGIEALDIDPQAVRAAHENAARNGVALRAALPDAAGGRYSLVLANILAKPLQLLAPLLSSYVAPRGWLVICGVLERQALDLQRAYSPHLPLQVVGADEGWALLAGAAPAGAEVGRS